MLLKYFGENSYKSIAVILLFILANFGISCAQQMPSGTSAIELGGGGTYNGVSFYGAYVRYFRDRSNKVGFGHLPCPGDKALVKFFPNRMYGKASLFYEKASENSIKYTSSGVDLAFYYTLIKIKESVFINLKGGAILSSDRINSGGENNNLQADDSQVNYGLLAGAEIEWFLSRRLTLVAGGDQRFLFNNIEPIENLRGFGYVGVRFNLVKNVERIF